MLAVPQIEKALDGPDKPDTPDNPNIPNGGTFGDSGWLWYIVLAIPVTVFALVAYASWEYGYKRKYLKSLFGATSNEKFDDIEMMSDMESNRSSLSLGP